MKAVQKEVQHRRVFEEGTTEKLNQELKDIIQHLADF